MLTTIGLRDYIKAIVPYEGQWFGVGQMDNTKERAICLRKGVKPSEIGGVGYFKEYAGLSIRWSKEAGTAENKAWEIFEPLVFSRFELEGQRGRIQAADSGPVFTGVDGKGVYCYEISLEIYTEVSL